MKNKKQCPSEAVSGQLTFEGAAYEECMKIAMCMMDMCDTVYMLAGWRNSRGANREYGYALGRDMTVLMEETEDHGQSI
ncbi:DUF4406 domain-containing protein [Bacilliculturomica massiliensis]|uniref:DUF4406 domain-containing protein n=1 Tax=Bacilliculturomica massiliensis TaxID=1917867 RepID=UPI0010322C5C|nr:DUF4406 domain-containing protein [Bacilliculturomica massiliensis]